MTYKEFNAWANERVCDGQWGLQEAIISVDICRKMSKVSILYRKREWEKYKLTAETIVEIIEAKLKELRGE